jgi:hypothetical protein
VSYWRRRDLQLWSKRSILTIHANVGNDATFAETFLETTQA